MELNDLPRELKAKIIQGKNLKCEINSSWINSSWLTPVNFAFSNAKLTPVEFVYFLSKTDKNVTVMSHSIFDHKTKSGMSDFRVSQNCVFDKWYEKDIKNHFLWIILKTVALKTLRLNMEL